MKRLSLLDALFLYLETPETPMHVGSVTIFKPELPRDDLFARFRAHTAARLDLLPSYRRRLEPTPLGIDHPAWVIEEKLDLDIHIRQAALPRPGGMKELRTLIAQRHALPLDRVRPLWEYTFIEGLEGGAFAVYAKVHHCAMDGLAGVATLGVTYDFAPGAENPPQRIFPLDAEPSDFIELTATAIGDFIRQGWRAITSLPGFVRALTKAAPHFGRDARFLYRYVKDMPRTPLNSAISGHRVYATASLPLAEVKALAKSCGATINDVVLAVSAGALRRYLAAALPDKPLTAGVPASLRPPGDAHLNNQVVFTLSRLPTDVAEPLKRLAAAQAASHEAKNLFADIRDLIPTDISILGAPLAVTGLARLWGHARASNYLGPFFNIVISNVPGPRQTMYCAGAPATHSFPVSVPYHGCALNITAQSYLDQLDFGLIACGKTVPQAQRIADFIVEDFAAMRAALSQLQGTGAIAAARPAPVAAHKPIEVGEAKAEARPRKKEMASTLAQQIGTLADVTEALLHRIGEAQPPARAKSRPAKTKTAAPRKRAASKASAKKRATGKAAARRS